MSWFCPSKTVLKENYLYQSYNQFSKIDLQTKKIIKQVTLYQHGDNFIKYQGWQKTKFRSKNFQQILKDVKQSGNNFKDPQFAHSNQKIGIEHSQSDIKWMRVDDIIQSPVYSNEYKYQQLSKFKCSNRSLQNALVLMARIQPKKFIDLLSKTLCQQGIYQFKFFINGIIQYVIIDDYIPTFKKIPLFVGPVRQKQVYPMLIQKALAKAFGSYQNIPFQTQILMQTLFCAPSRKLDLNTLKQKKQQHFLNIIQQTLHSNAHILLQSKSQVKIRNYGINQNQLYQLRNHFTASIQSNNFNLYQIVSQNKLSSWNGKFSLNDQIWSRVDTTHRAKIFSQIKKNKSFCIQEDDISRLFSHILIFQDTFSKNKDWEINTSKNGLPSFSQFYLKQKDKVLIRCSTHQNIRQNIIIAERLGLQKFRFITGSLQTNKSTCQVYTQLNQGHYIICVIHDWITKQSGQYSLFLQSSQFTDLNKSNQFLNQIFLQKMFLSYSNKHQSDKQNENHAENKLYSVFVLGDEIGFAFVHIRAYHIQKDSIILQVDNRKLQRDKWVVLQPYQNEQQIMIEKNSQKIVIVKSLNRKEDKIHFPSNAFKIRQ